MNYLLIVLTVLFLTSQTVLSKQYGTAVKHSNVFFFGSLSAMAAILFFVVTSGFRLSFDIKVLPYSIAFAVFYAMANVSLVLALKNGSMALTNLIFSYSLIIPTLYGILILKDAIKPQTYVGIAFLLISLFLLNKTDQKEKISFRWLIFVMLAFVGNGMCSTVQKMQQLRFEGGYKSEFMIGALIIAALVLLVAAVIQGIKEKPTACMKFAIPHGLANGAVNLFIMFLTGMVANAILFPSISAGGIILTFFISVFVYKEALTRTQLAGYIIGLGSIILLNL